jgi:hypothetical protein
MHVRRIETWIVCGALALALGPGRAWAAAPPCGNMMAQAGGAGVSVYAQGQQLVKVCTQNGWDSTQCLAQGAVVGQALVWFWWTSSQWYCQCTKNPPQLYCQAIGALPAPRAPGGAGGGGALPPAGPAPPPPQNAKPN